MGLSEVKKLDLRRRGEGEGGIWDRVSIVRSESDGRGLRSLDGGFSPSLGATAEEIRSSST